MIAMNNEVYGTFLVADKAPENWRLFKHVEKLTDKLINLNVIDVFFPLKGGQ